VHRVIVNFHDLRESHFENEEVCALAVWLWHCQHSRVLIAQRNKYDPLQALSTHILRIWVVVKRNAFLLYVIVDIELGGLGRLPGVAKII